MHGTHTCQVSVKLPLGDDDENAPSADSFEENSITGITITSDPLSAEALTIKSYILAKHVQPLLLLFIYKQVLEGRELSCYRNLCNP